LPLFDDPLHDEFSSWILGFAPYGGGDVGEVEQLATQVPAGDDDSFFEAFSGFAHGLLEEGEAALAAGHTATARDCHLRAAAYLGVAYHVLYGTPVDPRLVDAFHLQMDAFTTAMGLWDPPAQALEIPYEGTHMPGWFVRNPRRPDARLPTIIVGGGWDSTMVENFLAMGVAALDRDYHVLVHDGPGQGRLLVDEGLTLRHDWEHVVAPVVDAALAIDVVDPAGIVYQPWSLGGYMAPRVAAHEPRLAAVVADPGQLDVGGKVVAGLRLMGLTDEQAARLPHLDPDFAAGAQQFMAADRTLDWSVLRRGLWTNGGDDFASWLVEMWNWKLDAETVARITCPVLVTSAEGDRASTDSEQLYDLIRAPKAHLHFTAAEGAGMHCEMLNRSLANRRILDWLDDTLAAQAEGSL
jgi:pimeloyl-ACP methyl ester carboxylesterase